MKMPRSFGFINLSLLKKFSHYQLVAVGLMITGLVSTASAATIVYTGTTTGGPLWNRPVDNALDPPDTLSLDGDAVPFDSHPFQIGTSGLYSFLSDTSPVGWDNYLFLYVTNFDPLNPLQNVIIGNDDFNFTIGQSGFNANLTSGVDYFLVTTGFADMDAGDFTNTIDLLQASTGGGPSTGPPTDPAAAPEPNTFLLLGTGLALAGAWRKRPIRLS